MAIEVLANMAVAYGNQVNPTNVSAIVTGGITSFVSGYPAENLEIEDPWTMTKTSVVASAPSFEHQFASSLQLNALGILNHNFHPAYTSLTVEYWNGSTFVSVGAVTLYYNSDIWVSWDGSNSSARWRFRLNSGTTNLRIGSVFWGFRYAMLKSPATALMSQARESPLLIEQSAGDARHVIFGAAKRTATMEVSWSRAPILDVDFFRTLGNNEMIGIMPPEHGDDIDLQVLGQEPFWGYVASRVMVPRGPGGRNTTQPATYDMTLTLEGAV